MAKIYTRTGDDGTTGLFGGPRVAKDDVRVAAYGDVDELNSQLGVVLAGDLPADLREALTRVQHELFALGAELASPDPEAFGTATLGSAAIERLERAIDRCVEAVPPLREFVLPGGTPAAARLHVARCVCRRAERSVVTLRGIDADRVRSVPVVYLNRLSDLLFAAAHYANHAAGAPDVPWDKSASEE